METQSLISASEARAKIDKADTEISVLQWTKIVADIHKAVERNQTSVYLSAIAPANQKNCAHWATM
jgi:hypothetical protein